MFSPWNNCFFLVVLMQISVLYYILCVKLMFTALCLCHVYYHDCVLYLSNSPQDCVHFAYINIYFSWEKNACWLAWFYMWLFFCFFFTQCKYAIMKRLKTHYSRSHCMTSRLNCWTAPMLICLSSVSSSICISDVARCLQADIHAVCATLPWGTAHKHTNKPLGQVSSATHGISAFLSQSLN